MSERKYTTEIAALGITLIAVVAIFQDGNPMIGYLAVAALAGLGGYSVHELIDRLRGVR